MAVAEGNGTLAKQRAVTLGEPSGTIMRSSAAYKPGDKVIVSGTQFLIDGAPVQPIQLIRRTSR